MELQTISVLSIFFIILQKTVCIQTYYVENKTPAKHYNTQHRFPQLQKVIERIDSDSKHYVAGRTLATSADATSVSSSYLRTPDSRAKTPDEDYYEDHIDENDDEEEEEEDDEEDEDEDDEESEVKTIKGHQSYQPHSAGRPQWESGRTPSTSSSVTTRTPPRAAASPHHRHQPPAPQAPISSYSQFKWNTFGTPQGVDEYRKARMNPNYNKPSHHIDAVKAQEHAYRVNQASRCRLPRAKVIHVKDIHPEPSKIFVPHCTVLHRCGNDTGCCPSEKQACLPTKEHFVELYFISTSTTVSYEGSTRYSQQQPPASSVVRLLFSNHTECACRDKHDEQMPRDMAQTRPLPPPPPSPSRAHYYPPLVPPSSSTRAHYYLPPPVQETPTRTRSGSESCRCPTEFYPRHLVDGSCTCDCFDKQRDCLRFKKGKEYFTHQDKSCIERRVCQTPQCEYGSYSRVAGRCPTLRKQDKFSSWHRN